MAKRKFLILVGSLSLFLGGLIYLLFRENTYIAILFNCQLIENIRYHLIGLNADFFRFYFPDFLWALSLNCYLLALFNPKRNGVIYCVLIVFFYGTLWETGQYINVLNGTGDINDIIMYLSASIFAALICIKEKRK